MINGGEINAVEINGAVESNALDWQLRMPFGEFALDWQLRLVHREYVDWQLRLPVSYSVDWQLRMPWSETDTLDWQRRLPWAELDYDLLDWQFRLPHTEWIDWQTRLVHGEQAEFGWQMQLPYTTGSLDWQLRLPYTGHLDWQLRLPNTFSHDVDTDWQLRLPFAALDYEPLDWQFRLPYVEHADVYQTFSSTKTATINGVTVRFTDCEIASDLDSPYWQLTATLARVQDYALFTRDTAFTVAFYGTTYSFIVDARTLLRANALDGTPQDEARITGLSPLALKASPRANTVTKTYSSATMAKTIVEDLIGSVTWECLDWPIPANLFGVSQVAPLQAAMQITDAIGAAIISNPDGSVVVRSRYPVKIPLYSVTAADAELAAADIYAVNETMRAQRLVNRVTVLSGDPALATEQDSLEFIVDEADGLTGTVRGYLNPWDGTARIDTTRSGVTLRRLGTVYRTESEEIEIIDGRGTVRYPITSVKGLEWRNINLGGVSFEGREITTGTTGYSLLYITYRTRAIEYTSTATSDRNAQHRLIR